MQPLLVIGVDGMEEEDMEMDIHCEPAGHGEIATCNVTICKEFWRTLVRISVVMD